MRFYIDGPNVIQEGFDKSNGKPFEVQAVDTRHVFVSSPAHIKELQTGSNSVLSLYASARKIIQPKYTMKDFNWMDFSKGGKVGWGFLRAVRTCLTDNLPNILGDLTNLTRSELPKIVSTHPTVDGAYQVSTHLLITRLVVMCNVAAFFGPGLANDDVFVKAAQDYIEHTIFGGEIIRFTPSRLIPFVARIINRVFRSQDIVYDTLLPIAEKRLREREEAAELGLEMPKHHDCIQWTIESLPHGNYLTPRRLVHELMGIWFGSVHALATTITVAIHDLCLHPEYIQPIRDEITAHYSEFEHTAHGLPLLDSFIKESARLTPAETLSTRREATDSFTFSDGTHLKAGDWAVTPLLAINKMPEYYPSPNQFNGFRFAPKEVLDSLENKTNSSPLQAQPSKLTDIDATWLMFGIGRQSCPGRFYASATMKVIISQVLKQYDIKLVDEKMERSWVMRSAIVPRDGVKVAFKPRN
ncbi:cytochrome P450 [Podospora fimiseda]|uniref:Cytochrome P450 n=1 Tax=Podospora fimiseda TaxID=252190 RepID=A0AAN7BJQ1_9PEZI|nr:cytochrome P450 [Podospora fimiseda]